MPPDDPTPDPTTVANPARDWADAERLHLFAWTGYPEHRRYLRTLRALDALRSSYTAQARPLDLLDTMGTDAPDVDALLRDLDQLTSDGLLERSQDGTRVASIAEYRKRRPVYQFTDTGYRAYRSVEDVLAFRPEDATLQRFAFAAIAEDLGDLAAANATGDAARVHRILHQLDLVFRDMAERASQFYVMIGQLSQVHDARAELFLEFKDRLLAYLGEFLAELQRSRPVIETAIAAVEATGIELLVERAAEADDSPFSRPVERAARWRDRWDGLVRWFRGDAGRLPAADELDRATTRAIADLSALLRRLSETSSRGISRTTELEHLAAWFAATPTPDATHALFAATFRLSPARHLGGGTDRTDRDPPSQSWWDGEPVAIAATLRERGVPPSPGRPAPVADDTAARRHARDLQEAAMTSAAAAREALTGGLDTELDHAQLRELLALLDRALRARVPVSGHLRSAEARSGGVHVRLVPADHDTQVATVDGTLVLPGTELELTRT